MTACRVSGVGYMEVDSDEECIAAIKEYLSFFPSHNQEPPPIMATDDPIDRMDAAIAGAPATSAGRRG